MSSITLFGAGSWGTALAVHLAQAGRTVTPWARRAEVVEQMVSSRRNPSYLPDVRLPSDVRVTANLDMAAEASNLWALAVPSQFLRAAAAPLRPHLRDEVMVVSLAKGIEADTLLPMSQVLGEVFESVAAHRIGVLHGPSHAEEVAEEGPTTVVAAASAEAECERIRDVFMTDTLRVYMNTDVMGVEIGGAAKNVLAIAAGICDGVGYGDNAKAALVTRGLAEIRRLGLAMGAQARTFSGLSGIGDLMVTCMSGHSRNRRLGEQIGQGLSLPEVLDAMTMVAEGVETTRSIHALAERHDLEMPITEAVYAVLFDGASPREVAMALMTRDAKWEHWLPDALADEA